MMHSGYEDDEFSIEPNRTFYIKKNKNNHKIQKSSSVARRGELKLVRLSLVQFDSIRNPLKVRWFHCISYRHIFVWSNF
jgi:hypothetical protein